MFFSRAPRETRDKIRVPWEVRDKISEAKKKKLTELVSEQQ